MRLKNIASVILAAALCLVPLTSCEKEEEPVMTVDTFEVTYDTYRYIVLNAKTDVEAKYGEDVWVSSDADTAEAEAEASIKNYLAKSATVLSLAAEYGIDRTSAAIEAEVEGSIAEMIEGYEVESEFYEELEALGMTEEVLYTLAENELLNEMVYEAIAEADEESLREGFFDELFESDGLIRVKQILTGGENGGTNEENLEKSEQLLEQLEGGADFDRLAQEENCDLFMFQNDDGYYILRGTRDKNFEEAAFSLEIGEMSGIVDTEAGYTIIKRYEKDSAYIEANYDELVAEYYEGLYTAKFESRLEEISSGIGKLPAEYSISDME